MYVENLQTLWYDQHMQVNKRNTCNHWIVKPFSKKTHVHSYFCIVQLYYCIWFMVWCFHNSICNKYCIWIWPQNNLIMFYHKCEHVSIHSQKMCKYVIHLAKTTIYYDDNGNTTIVDLVFTLIIMMSKRDAQRGNHLLPCIV